MLTQIIFILTTVLAIWMLFKASGNKALFLFIPLLLASLQALGAKMGLFHNPSQTPPLILFVPLTSILCIVMLFVFPSGRKMLSAISLKQLTALHVVRIPVELVLYMLFLDKQVPELMTFAGQNPDILSGITAPLVLLLFFRNHKINKTALIIWNVLCLMLLFNIVIRAVLSLPTPFQKLGFDQPNIAILSFPYIWLPGIVVPIVLLSHLVALRQLIQNKKS